MAKVIEELNKVRKEREVMKLHMEILANEKELHIEEHAVATNNWKKEKKRLLDVFEEEKIILKKLYQQAVKEADKYKKLYEDSILKPQQREISVKKKDLKSTDGKFFNEKEKILRVIAN